MNIACIGGGPASLCFALAMKRRDRSHKIWVIDRKRREESVGWGIVLADRILETLRLEDPIAAAEIGRKSESWDRISVTIDGSDPVVCAGHPLSSIARSEFVEILRRRAEHLGVQLDFSRQIDSPACLVGSDLVVGGDGFHSAVREAVKRHVRPDTRLGKNKYAWFGIGRTFSAFNFFFVRTSCGWIWAHAYPFASAFSTFIIECSERTWRALGLDATDIGRSIEICESIFASALSGAHLLTYSDGRPMWTSFAQLQCARWSHRNLVLMGDAAHTAHFSIGSGSRLAIDDAISLADSIVTCKDDLSVALRAYELNRMPRVRRAQDAARRSSEWFEAVDVHMNLEPTQFVYSLLTRSHVVTHSRLRKRDADFIGAFERWHTRLHRDDDREIEPLRVPARIGPKTFAHRLGQTCASMQLDAIGHETAFYLVRTAARGLQGGPWQHGSAATKAPHGLVSARTKSPILIAWLAFERDWRSSLFLTGHEDFDGYAVEVDLSVGCVALDEDLCRLSGLARRESKLLAIVVRPSVETTAWIASHLELVCACFDFIVANGSMNDIALPPAALVEAAAHLRQTLELPVMCVTREITPDEINTHISAGRVDFICIDTTHETCATTCACPPALHQETISLADEAG